MTNPVTSTAPARISYSGRRFRPVGDEPGLRWNYDLCW